MTDYPAKRLKVGTMQASMPDGVEHYAIERWDGTRWQWVTELFDTHVVIPLTLLCTFSSKADADRALQASGLPWRK